MKKRQHYRDDSAATRAALVAHVAAHAAVPAPVLALPAGWRPIAEAPKDGSQFLIWTKRLGFAVVEHAVDDPMPTDIVPSGHHLTVNDGKHGPYSIRGDYPTHFQPLPAPPGAAAPPSALVGAKEPNQQAVFVDLETGAPLDEQGDPISPAAASGVAATEPPIWYMRDNHTFRRLPADVVQALDAMREEFADGYTHGMLCSRMTGCAPPIHGHGVWDEFAERARTWLIYEIEARAAAAASTKGTT